MLQPVFQYSKHVSVLRRSASREWEPYLSILVCIGILHDTVSRKSSATYSLSTLGYFRKNGPE